MSDDTPRLALGQMVDGQELDAMAINDALIALDALTDISLKGQFVNTPPSSPADGDMYLLGGAPTGVWTGYASKIAYCIDGLWRFYTPFDGLRAFVAPTNGFLVYENGIWTDANALISANEISIASAATCDLGAAASLFVAITGTTAITGFGAGANLLRFVRFAGALTLTHNATTLILPGAANIATLAGDTAIFASDSSGNWRCRGYARATRAGLAADVCAAGPAGMALTSAGLGTASANPLPFVINNAETGRIAADGSLLWGTAVSGGWNGSSKSEFRAAGDALSAYTTGAGGGDAIVVRTDSTSTNGFVGFYNGATKIGEIFAVTSTTTTYATTSDARRKTVCPQQGDYRQAIAALWVGDFTWKENGESGFGVLAQQAWEVMPHHLGVHRPVRDEETWHASSEPFAFLALWGVKDLYALIEALSARVAALEAAHATG